LFRAPFQVLVFPFNRSQSNVIQYAIFSRADYSCWQGIAGGGENSETPWEAARRESWEEAQIPMNCQYLQLDTVNSIPVIHFKDSYVWGENTYVIPEYTFGVDLGEHRIQLSHEHQELRWVTYEEAVELLKYEGSKIALWELNQKLKGKGPRE
jgi:dihydroneopterin triphosphate diphosphatase